MAETASAKNLVEIIRETFDFTSNFQDSKHKTELCRAAYKQQRCRFSNQCDFAHLIVELRPRVFDHVTFKKSACCKWPNSCHYRTRCLYLHDEKQYVLNEKFSILHSQHENKFRLIFDQANGTVAVFTLDAECNLRDDKGMRMITSVWKHIDSGRNLCTPAKPLAMEARSPMKTTPMQKNLKGIRLHKISKRGRRKTPVAGNKPTDARKPKVKQAKPIRDFKQMAKNLRNLDFPPLGQQQPAKKVSNQPKTQPKSPDGQNYIKVVNAKQPGGKEDKHQNSFAPGRRGSTCSMEKKEDELSTPPEKKLETQNTVPREMQNTLTSSQQYRTKQNMPNLIPKHVFHPKSGKCSNLQGNAPEFQPSGTYPKSSMYDYDQSFDLKSTNYSMPTQQNFSPDNSSMCNFAPQSYYPNHPTMNHNMHQMSPNQYNASTSSGYFYSQNFPTQVLPSDRYGYDSSGMYHGPKQSPYAPDIPDSGVLMPPSEPSTPQKISEIGRRSSPASEKKSSTSSCKEEVVAGSSTLELDRLNLKEFDNKKLKELVMQLSGKIRAQDVSIRDLLNENKAMHSDYHEPLDTVYSVYNTQETEPYSAMHPNQYQKFDDINYDNNQIPGSEQIRNSYAYSPSFGSAPPYHNYDLDAYPTISYFPEDAHTYGNPKDFQQSTETKV